MSWTGEKIPYEFSMVLHRTVLGQHRHICICTLAYVCLWNLLLFLFRKKQKKRNFPLYGTRKARRCRHNTRKFHVHFSHLFDMNEKII